MFYFLIASRMFVSLALKQCIWTILWMLQEWQFWQDMFQGFKKNRYPWSYPVSFRGIIKYCVLSLLKVAGNCSIIKLLCHYQGIDHDKDKSHVKFFHSYGPNSGIFHLLWVGKVSLPLLKAEGMKVDSYLADSHTHHS